MSKKELKQSNLWPNGQSVNPQRFSILLPPPNVSGSLHIGHALGFFLQDSLGRLASLLVGRENTFLLPGLDHGGISTQYSALKSKEYLELKSEKEKIKIVHDFANNAQKSILNQLSKFNLIANMDLLQYTMDAAHTELVNQAFVTLYNKGLIYEEERIIYWDTYFNSSLSTLEIKHETKKDKLYYIKYKLTDGEEVTVATTRPETMFGDVALAVGEKHKTLTGKTAIIPIVQRKIPIVFDKEVLDDFGTGILKITPGHDEVDFRIGKRHKLPIINILDADFKLNHNTPIPYSGLTCKEARSLIVEELQKQRLLDKEEVITHNVIYGDKSDTPIETIVKKQWYLDLSVAARKSVELLEKGEWHIFPKQWINSYKSWMSDLQPWCISREILWGHQIPVWRQENGTIIVALSEEEASKKSNNQPIKRDNFVLDTWFSSALWPFAYKEFPTSVLVTGYDILLFWVARMVMMSLELYNILPFSNVLLHDLVRDGKGQKMSKTKGNVSNPLELIEEYGADIVRYALLSKISLRGKICFSNQDIENSKKLYNKLKNVITFLEIYCKEEDFTDYLNTSSMTLKNPMVIYFVEKFNTNALEDLFINYNLDAYLEWLYEAFWHDYCDWFVEMSKKQIKDNSAQSKEIKFALIYLLDKLLCYFYGVFPKKIENIYHKLFRSIPKLPKIVIKHEQNIEKNKKYMEDLIFMINQIRSLQGNDIRLYIQPQNEEEQLIFESLKIPLTTEIATTGFIEVIIRNQKIYLIHKDSNVSSVQKMIEKQEKEMKLIEAKLQEALPPSIWKSFNEKYTMAKETIEILNNYLKICKV